MSVAKNVAFGLEIRKRPKPEVEKRVAELLELVHLSQFSHRLPAQLSGGQRQRMALARALAVEPTVLLLDEPFGALDAKVRKELREWLRRLHDEVHVTTVFVTHDQEEALEVADEIVVINDGRIEQVGTPDQLYDEPASDFVMSFLGPVTKLSGRLVRPHDIEVYTTPEDSQAQAGKIVRLLRVGLRGAPHRRARGGGPPRRRGHGHPRDPAPPRPRRGLAGVDLAHERGSDAGADQGRQRLTGPRPGDSLAARHRSASARSQSMGQENSVENKAAELLRLHQDPTLLTVVNVWDSISAKVVADTPGTAALATASHSIAASLGYPDGENIPVDLMIEAVGRIVEATTLPVSADLEGGYGDPAGTVRKAIGVGVVGANIEDQMRPLDEAVANVQAIMDAAISEGVPDFVLNARTDAFVLGRERDQAEVLADAVERSKAYVEAGAPVVFVPGKLDEDAVTTLVDALGPQRLTVIGVTRYAVAGAARGARRGPGLLRADVPAGGTDGPAGAGRGDPPRWRSAVDDARAQLT